MTDKEWNGLKMPDVPDNHIRHTMEHISDTCSKDFSHIRKYIAKDKIAVQAGGHIGYVPIMLSPYFAKVISFEPNEINTQPFKENTKNFPNIELIQACVGDDPKLRVKLFTQYRKEFPDGYDNWGGAQIDKNITGDIPVVTIDSLGLTSVGLIWLDIEGYEYFGFNGAINTIKACRPVCAFELNSKNDYYIKVDLIRWFHKLGYHLVVSTRDIIMVPN